MDKSKLYDDFVVAYNNFDPRPLSGETLKKFYIDDFAKEYTDNIITTINITAKYRKILIVGDRGCGKSTVLNKVIEDVKDRYHVIYFSAQEELNLADVDTIDILLNVFHKIMLSIKERKDTMDRLVDSFKQMTEIIRKTLSVTEAGLSLFGTLSLKIRVEDESRLAIRKAFQPQINELIKQISQACININQQFGKDVLIVIDDLEKMFRKEQAQKIFFEETRLLVMPDVKIIYTFPLYTFHDPQFNQIDDQFDHLFIHTVPLYDFYKEYQTISFEQLKKLILQRIQSELVSEDALKEIIDKSGGLVRDIIKFMQDACKKAIVKNASSIDEPIAKSVTIDKINQYYRLFDFPTYGETAAKIMESRDKTGIKDDMLYDLLRYLFVLEYRKEGQVWFDLHPCLKEVIDRVKYHGSHRD